MAVPTREQLIENIKAFESQGAPQEDIQAYLDSFQGQTPVTPIEDTFQEENKGLIQKIGQVFGEEQQKAREYLDETTRRFQAGEENILQAVPEALSTIPRFGMNIAARATGAAGRAISPLIAPPIKEVAKGLGEAAGKFPLLPLAEPLGILAKKGIEEYQKLPEGVRRTFGAIGQIGSAQPAGVALKTAAKPAVETLEVAAKKAITPTVEKLSKEAITSLEKKYKEDVFSLTKPSVKEFQKSLEKGKDPAKFLAEKRIVVDIEGGKIRPAKQISQLKTDASQLSKILDEVLVQKSPGVIRTPLNDLRKKALQAVDNPQTQSQGLVSVMQKKVNKVFDEYRKIYGDSLDLTQINSIKKGQYKLTSTFEPTVPSYARDVNRIIAKEAKKEIENKVDDVSIKELNDYIGDHFDAIDLLGKVEGNTVKYGRLGKLFAVSLGVAVPKSGAGKILGALGASYLVDAIQSNYISDPLKRFLINRAKTTNPPAYNEAIKFLQQSAQEQVMRPRLPAPTTIYGPEFKGAKKPTQPTAKETLEYLKSKGARKDFKGGTKKIKF